MFQFHTGYLILHIVWLQGAMVNGLNRNSWTIVCSLSCVTAVLNALLIAHFYRFVPLGILKKQLTLGTVPFPRIQLQRCHIWDLNMQPSHSQLRSLILMWSPHCKCHECHTFTQRSPPSLPVPDRSVCVMGSLVILSASLSEGIEAWQQDNIYFKNTLTWGKLVFLFFLPGGFALICGPSGKLKGVFLFCLQSWGDERLGLFFHLCVVESAL